MWGVLLSSVGGFCFLVWGEIAPPGSGFPMPTAWRPASDANSRLATRRVRSWHAPLCRFGYMGRTMRATAAIIYNDHCKIKQNLTQIYNILHISIYNHIFLSLRKLVELFSFLFFFIFIFLSISDNFL